MRKATTSKLSQKVQKYLINYKIGQSEKNGSRSIQIVFEWNWMEFLNWLSVVVGYMISTDKVFHSLMSVFFICILRNQSWEEFYYCGLENKKTNFI